MAGQLRQLRRSARSTRVAALERERDLLVQDLARLHTQVVALQQRGHLIDDAAAQQVAWAVQQQRNAERKLLNCKCQLRRDTSPLAQEECVALAGRTIPVARGEARLLRQAEAAQAATDAVLQACRREVHSLHASAGAPVQRASREALEALCQHTHRRAVCSVPSPLVSQSLAAAIRRTMSACHTAPLEALESWCGDVIQRACNPQDCLELNRPRCYHRQARARAGCVLSCSTSARGNADVPAAPIQGSCPALQAFVSPPVAACVRHPPHTSLSQWKSRWAWRVRSSLAWWQAWQRCRLRSLRGRRSCGGRRAL